MGCFFEDERNEYVGEEHQQRRNMMSTIKSILLFILLFFANFISAQNKSGYTWIVGNNASYGAFDGSANRPQTGSVYQTTSPNFPYAFTAGSSNICDSATGKLLLLCNGMQVFDTAGHFIDNGDSLVPSKIYGLNVLPNAPAAQGSIILPKGINTYYIFTPTVSDTTFDKWFAPNATKTPYDMLLYHIVDMNANGGLGKVIKKKIELLTNTEMSRTNMTACRHSNGIDWWLLKKIGYESNHIARFLVTKDSIYGPYFQYFAKPDFGIYDATGQSSFSPDGKKYASVQGKSNKLFMADFDRCTGELSNPKVFNIPIDSTSYQPLDNAGNLDSIIGGCTFSPNNKYLYISKRFNIYQFEYDEPDSSLAWYNVKRGTDTTWVSFEYYLSLKLGIDNRIYIGKAAGSHKQFSVIDYPDIKGVGCGFCRKCFRVDSALGGLNTPPNIPNFNLGASAQVCWPLSSQQLAVGSEQLVLYPNPSRTRIDVRYERRDKRNASLEIYNTIGQRVYSSHISSAMADTSHVSIDVSNLSTGVYYLRCENQVVKVIIE
jgi:hypothetical protein